MIAEQPAKGQPAQHLRTLPAQTARPMRARLDQTKPHLKAVLIQTACPVRAMLTHTARLLARTLMSQLAQHRPTRACARVDYAGLD